MPEAGPSRQTDLLIACLRQSFDPREGDPDGPSLPRSEADWERFLALAAGHRVLPAVARRLLRGDLAPRLPAPLPGKLEALIRSNDTSGAALRRAAIEGVRLLGAGGVRAIPWGGSALALGGLDRGTPRQWWGGEIRIDPAAIGPGIAALERGGYRPWRERPPRHLGAWRAMMGEETMVEPEHGRVARILWDPSTPHHRLPLRFEETWRRCRDAAMGGSEARHPDPADLLIAGSLRGAEQGWRSLSLALDTLLIARAMSPESWESLPARARGLRAARMVRTALLFAGAVASVDVPAPVEEFLNEDPAARQEANVRRSRLETAPGPRADDRGSALREAIRSHDRPGGKLGVISRRLFRPTEDDFRALPLPRALAPAYALVRPVRLLARRLRSARSEDWKARAPYLGSPPEAIGRMLSLAEVGASDVLFDLGCGDGRIVIEAARRCGARGVGIEIAPDLIDRARRAAAEAGVRDRVEFHVGDVQSADLSKATVVALYLPPAVVLKLRGKLERELPRGARIVAHEVEIPGWRPERVEVIPTEHGITQVHLWRIS